MISNPSAPRLAAVLAFTLSSVVAGPAAARRNGIQIAGCDGCHGQNSGSTITLTPDHDPIAPGDVVNFVATIAWPGIKVGGIYVPKPDLGTLGTSAGQGLTLSSGALTHTSPKAAAGDTVTFSFTWTAPDEPGSVLVGAYFVAGNNNGQYTGDSPGGGYLSFVWGCEPTILHYDIDGDGHGTPVESTGDPGTLDSGTLVGCAALRRGPLLARGPHLQRRGLYSRHSDGGDLQRPRRRLRWRGRRRRPLRPGRAVPRHPVRGARTHGR